jgi:hypothetical protein
LVHVLGLAPSFLPSPPPPPMCACAACAGGLPAVTRCSVCEHPAVGHCSLWLCARHVLPGPGACPARSRCCTLPASRVGEQVVQMWPLECRCRRRCRSRRRWCYCCCAFVYNNIIIILLVDSPFAHTYTMCACISPNPRRLLPPPPCPAPSRQALPSER